MKRILFWIHFVDRLLWHFAHEIIDTHYSDRLELLSNINCGRIGSASNDGGRVINGSPVTQVYPWLFQILRRRRRRPKKGSMAKEQVIAGSMGSLISTRTIVTCAHCVCDAPLRVDPLTVHGCREQPMEPFPGPDQIIPRKNDILVLYLENQFPSYQPNVADFFDNHLTTQNKNGPLQAYVYKYEPIPPRKVSKNGDVGIIILPRPATLVWPEVIPLCLPHPDVLHLKGKLKAVVIGSGARYDETNNAGLSRQTNTSCITNYGMKKNRKLPNIQHAFLPCRKHAISGHGSNSYCTKLSFKMFPPHMSANVLHAISTSIDVKFKYRNGQEPNTFERSVTIRETLPQPTTYKCDILWPKVKAAIKSMPN